MEFLELFIPIEKMPAQAAFISGLIIMITFLFALISIIYFPNKMIIKLSCFIKTGKALLKLLINMVFQNLLFIIE